MGNRSYLIDTNIFIWFLENNKRLSPKILDLLASQHSNIILSTASLWEIVLKQTAGKLKTPKNLREVVDASGYKVLDINLEHIIESIKLPKLHKDPFDRMLIAQAKTENLTLITSDKKILKYKIKTLEV